MSLIRGGCKSASTLLRSGQMIRLGDGVVSQSATRLFGEANPSLSKGK